MATTETNFAVKPTADSVNSVGGTVQSRSPDAAAAFKDAFDGASLAGIRGYVDERAQTGDPRMAGIRGFSDQTDRVDGPRVAGIRGFSDQTDRVDGPRVAGIRGFSQPNIGAGGATFADTAGMLRLRDGGDGGEPTMQFRNTGMKAYQDMLGMPALAVG